MVAVAQAEHIVLEIHDNYQKQTYRNRTYTAHNNGELLLNIPIKHLKKGVRQQMQAVQIENDFPWQSHHWKSMKTAYRTSPFFEYYEDELAPLFETPANSLLELNLQIFDLLCDLIGITAERSTSETYDKTPEATDLRFLIDIKKNKGYTLDTYTQVLQAHHGFLPNLSVLDLLFNEGPNTLNYLESQQIQFIK
ncbi:hypothetical protein GCM10008083_17750 [Ulvibacter litoralis]|nr:hypothetical protein GCM10008083_17750 [Ulvibacter litoralis]